MGLSFDFPTFTKFPWIFPIFLVILISNSLLTNTLMFLSFFLDHIFNYDKIVVINFFNYSFSYFLSNNFNFLFFNSSSVNNEINSVYVSSNICIKFKTNEQSSCSKANCLLKFKNSKQIIISFFIF